RQWVRPSETAARADDADAVAIAVEADAKVATAGFDRLLQLHQIFGDGRVGVVGWEGAVDRLVQQNMTPGERFGQRNDDITGRAIAAIPGDRQRAGGVVILRQPRDIIVEDAVLRDLPAPVCRSPERQRGLAELLDGIAEKCLA